MSTEHALDQIHKTMLARLSALKGSAEDLACAIKECCQDLPLGQVLRVSGHKLMPIKAQCRISTGKWDDDPCHWYVCRVLTIDRSLVPEPCVEEEGFYENGNGMTSYRAVFKQFDCNWFETEPYHRYEQRRERYQNLLDSQGCDPDYLMEPQEPSPLPLCFPDTLHEVAILLPGALATWHSERHAHLAAQAEHSRELTAMILPRV